MRLSWCLIAILMFCTACSSTIENRNPVGEAFPIVNGQSLEKESVTLPTDLEGRPAILLIGYKQRTQFDIDRWIMGLLQAEVDVPILELPTIPGLVPSLASDWIDDGMRSGIPKEDWSIVVTLYGKAAAPVAELTGTTDGQNARVILLNARGEIVWFYDRGYSAREALELANKAKTLARQLANQ